MSLPPVPTAVLQARQDLASLLSAGLSILSSITSEISFTPPSAASQTQAPSSSDSSVLFPTSLTSSASTARSTTASSTTSTSGTTSSSSTSSSSQTSSSSSSVTTTASPSSTDQPFAAINTGHGSNSKLPIILGVLLGLLALCLLALILCILCRRRRKRGYMFREPRPKSPAAFSDSEVGVDPVVPIVPMAEEHNPGSGRYYQYPAFSPTHQEPPLSPNGDVYGRSDLHNDRTQSTYTNSRRSMPLDSVAENRDAEHMALISSPEQTTRRWSTPSSGLGSSDITPLNGQRRGVSRKPVPDYQSQFGSPTITEDTVGNYRGVPPTRYYE